MNERESRDLPPETHAELERLVSELCEGAGGDVVQQRIAEIVGSNRAAARYYVECMYLDDEMSRNLSQQTEEAEILDRLPLAREKPSSAQLSRGAPTKISSLAYWREHRAKFAALALTLTVLFWAGFYYFVIFGMRGHESGPNSANYVARVTELREVAWAEEVQPLSIGHGFSAGEKVELIAGFVELEFAGGAQVLLEAPAVFVVETSRAGTLEQGRMVARVEQPQPGTVGFSISTPLAQIIDLGTEFGVEVSFDGTTSVEVFEGRVEATPRRRSGPRPSPPLRLAAGQAATLYPDTESFALREPTPAQFMQSMPEPPPVGTVVIAPVSATASGTNVEACIDGSGLQETGVIRGWTHLQEGDATSNWMTNTSQLPAVLELDLGQEYELSSLWLWNGAHRTTATPYRTVKDFQLEISTDGEHFTQVGEGILAVPEQYPSPGQAFPLKVRARYVRLVVLSNHSELGQDSPAGTDLALGEVRFEGVPVGGRGP